MNSLATAETKRKELATTLRRLAARAKLDLDDRGVRILHVGFGMLEWQQTETKEWMRSPIVMVPVELSRASRQKPWELSPCDEDIVVNPVLVVKLQRDFGVTLPDVPDNWDEHPLQRYLETVRAALNHPDWRVSDECWLGIFSFHKLPMYRDLDQNRPRLSGHSLIARLAGAAGDTDRPSDATCSPDELDRRLAPQDSFLVVDADSSQLAAIETVKLGTNLVLHGPPGTGKSQTITNVVAEMLAAGKTVLFVSEKMAALEVVYQRIERAGLGHLCLELHSHKASRRTVVDRLHHAMKHDLLADNGMSNAELARLAQRREQLNDYVVALHENRAPLERTVYEVLGEITTLSSIPMRTADVAWASTMTAAEYDWATRLAARLTGVWRIALQGRAFPWFGYVPSQRDAFSPQDLQSLLQRPADALTLVQSATSATAVAVGLPSPPSLRHARLIVRIAELCERHVQTHDEWLRLGNGRYVADLLRGARDGHEQASQRRRAIREKQGTEFLEGVHAEHSQSLTTLQMVLADRLGLPRDDGALVVSVVEAARWLCGLRGRLSQVSGSASQIADALGLGNQRLDLQRAWDYAELATICLSEPRPLWQWLSSQGLADAPAQIAGLKSHIDRWREAQDALLEVFDPSVLSLDLPGMIARYQNEHSSPVACLRPAYRRDARLLQACTNRKLSKRSARGLLLRAGEMLAARERADADGSAVVGGHYRGLDTDWSAIAEALDRAKVFGVNYSFGLTTTIIAGFAWGRSA